MGVTPKMRQQVGLKERRTMRLLCLPASPPFLSHILSIYAFCIIIVVKLSETPPLLKLRVISIDADKVEVVDRKTARAHSARQRDSRDIFVRPYGGSQLLQHGKGWRLTLRQYTLRFIDFLLLPRQEKIERRVQEMNKKLKHVAFVVSGQRCLEFTTSVCRSDAITTTLQLGGYSSIVVNSFEAGPNTQSLRSFPLVRLRHFLHNQGCWSSPLPKFPLIRLALTSIDNAFDDDRLAWGLFGERRYANAAATDYTSRIKLVWKRSGRWSCGKGNRISLVCMYSSDVLIANGQKALISEGITYHLNWLTGSMAIDRERFSYKSLFVLDGSFRSNPQMFDLEHLASASRDQKQALFQ